MLRFRTGAADIAGGTGRRIEAVGEVAAAWHVDQPASLAA